MQNEVMHNDNQRLLFKIEETRDFPLSESELYEDCFGSGSAYDFHPTYCRQNGLLFTDDSTLWLKQIEDNSIDVIFADPPYNIKKADWDKFESQEQYIQWSLKWIEESARILKSTGSLFVCGFSEILADLKHPSMHHFSGCRWLIWHYRNKANLGNDWGRSHESILHLRKSKNFVMNVDDIRIPYGKHTLRYPEHPQAKSSQYANAKKTASIWTPHPLGAKPKDVLQIPTTCNGMEEKTAHPTQKPEELLRKLILASSNSNNIILDPFSGSGTTLVVAEQLGRRWIGCEMNAEYNSWAIKRIDNVAKRTVSEWIEFDAANAKRRESIR